MVRSASIISICLVCFGIKSGAKPPVAITFIASPRSAANAAHNALQSGLHSHKKCRIAWPRWCYAQSRRFGVVDGNAMELRRWPFRNASSERLIPGAMTPPRYSPLADTTSNVVAVPKSITINGCFHWSHAAKALMRRSAPSSFRIYPAAQACPHPHCPLLISSGSQWR